MMALWRRRLLIIVPSLLVLLLGYLLFFNSRLTVGDGHAAVLLRDGTVLITGGSSTRQPLYKLSDETWERIKGFASPVAGLFQPVTVPIKQSLLYGPKTHRFSRTGNPTLDDNAAVLLKDGRVLAGHVGGVDNLPQFEVYDPASGTWQGLDCKDLPRQGPESLTALADGRALVTLKDQSVIYDGLAWTVVEGSTSGSIGVVLKRGRVLFAGDDPALFDPGSLRWFKVSHVPESLMTEYSMAALNDGRVLLYFSQAAYLFDPIGRVWTPTWFLHGEHDGARAVVLKNGVVLLAGGWNGAHPTAKCELYDPEMEDWVQAGSMKVARGRPSSTLLPDGRVLVVGGQEWVYPLAELYDPATGTWTDQN